MTDTVNATRIHQVATVFVPVADQERALEFYRDTLGFEKCADFTYGGGLRWVEVAPPGSVTALALVPTGEGASAGDDRTYCALAVGDIDAVHTALRTRGVEADAEIARTGTPRVGLVSTDVSVPDPVPPQFFFRDVDGNRFLVVWQRAEPREARA